MHLARGGAADLALVVLLEPQAQANEAALLQRRQITKVTSDVVGVQLVCGAKKEAKEHGSSLRRKQKKSTIDIKCSTHTHTVGKKARRQLKAGLRKLSEW